MCDSIVMCATKVQKPGDGPLVIQTETATVRRHKADEMIEDGAVALKATQY